MSNKVLDPNLWNLETLFKFMYDVPVYQRPYSWDKEQVDTLLFDLFEAYESPSRNDGYYTGNIIVYDKEEKVDGVVDRYDIIDGQQRITTFSLILMAIYVLSLGKGAPKTDPTILKVKESLWKYVNREYRSDLKAVTLNSIEKKCFSDLYDQCYDFTNNVMQFCYKYKCSSAFETRVINNFKSIYNYIDSRIIDDKMDSYLDFADFLLSNVQFIVILAKCNENKVFSMFESINSKGKRLEEIDLIKTYIFSKLDEKSYNTYLEKWGNLIIETQDNLYDYLNIYIKAYLRFYRNNIYFSNFQDVSKKELLTYFNVTNVCEAFKNLLDDMYEKVRFYNMLSSTEDAFNFVNNKKFRFYYKIFTEISYKHPKALFFRTLVEYSEGKISKESVIDIIAETISFMIKFLTISSRDSKDAITMFKGIMEDIYDKNNIDSKLVINSIATELFKQNITDDKLKSELTSLDAYEQNKKLTIALLSLFESTTIDNGKAKISYDQAYTLIDAFGNTFSLDHLLVQTPKVNDKQFKYFYDKNNDCLRLKKGHDFPIQIQDGMDYDNFKQLVLNKLGNLKLEFLDENSRRQNTLISLPEYNDFNSYKNIIERGNEIAKTLIDYCMPSPAIDDKITQAKKIKKISESNLPKMRELIEDGMIHIGDMLYVTVSPSNSKAILLDDKYVDYNGEKLTLNEWGCKVTGWKSIRIYAYVAIVGEIETLQEKRKRYIDNHNEPVN